MRYQRVLIIGLLFILLMGVSMVAMPKPEKIKIFNAAAGNIEEAEKVIKTEEEWKKILTSEQYQVTRQRGTESPFSKQCPLPAKGEKGIYQCVCCGTDLFKYEAKFESQTGWPSFWESVSELNIRMAADDNDSSGVHRIEVLCARCDAHLGHVFDDGPLPTGKRYCINTAALKLSMLQKADKTEKATFAAGCFWAVEAAFQQFIGKGVISTRVGYTGGNFKNPTYEDVCLDKTGHAEAVEIIYDPGKISYEKLLDIFWVTHDPATSNRQGPDAGSQYRSLIFFYTPEQERLAKASKDKLGKSKKFGNRIVTEIVEAKEFFPAEEYHQRYYEKKGIKPVCQNKG